MLNPARLWLLFTLQILDLRIIVYITHMGAFNMQCFAKKKAMYTAIEKIDVPFCVKIIFITNADK